MSVWLTIPYIVSNLLTLIVIIDFEYRANVNQTVFFSTIVGVLTVPCICCKVYDNGFLNDIADVKIGGSYLSLINAFIVLQVVLPQTIGV